MLWKLKLFDYNPRNYSAEVGYYLPPKHGGIGLGAIMLTLFIGISFNDSTTKLNKIYVTTALNNIPSIKLLEKSAFKLEGRLKEHYFINDDRFDQLIYSILRREWDKNES